MNGKRLFFSHRLALPIAVLAMVLVTAVGAAALEPGSQGPVTAGFTYQGRLMNDGGDPIDDQCDFRFTLWDDPVAGNQAGPLLNPTDVAVADGLFTVPLDFGAVFDGTLLWLQVAVQCSGDAGYTTLTPRQALTAAPYAAHALNADLLDGYDSTDLALAGHNHWGQAWTGTGTGLTLYGGNIGAYISGSALGVWGEATTAGGSAVHGVSTATDGAGQGVRGESYSSTGTGVYGNVTSTTGTTYGVYGQSNSNTGVGVYGRATAAYGTTYGVYAQSDSYSGIGVYGQGQSGVVADGDFCGVDAEGGNTGVLVEGGHYGVYASTTSQINGVAVAGIASSTVGMANGVVGGTHAPNGYGGYFYASGGTGTQTQAGVYGSSSSDIGYGVAGSNSANGTGVGAWSNTGRLIQASSGYYPYGTLRFYITTGGAVWADDGFYTFAATGDTDSGDGREYRTLYGMTGAEAWTEDFGRATLTDGQATVTIDPAFAQLVNLAQEYHIYLTAICPDLVVLAVTDQQPDRFTVQGATLDGTPSGCAFDYKIVAKQRGHEDERLEVVDIPEPVEGEDSHVPGTPEIEREDGR